MSRSVLIAIVVALAAVAWVGSGLVFEDESTGPSDTAVDVRASASGQPGVIQEPAEDEEAPARSVRVLRSQEQPVTNSLTLQGQTMADRTVEVRAKIEGQVTELAVSRGETVSEGQLIARLEVADREARVQEAEALVAQREVEFSASERLNAQGHRSDTDLAASRAALDAARAQLHLAQLTLERTEIRAPFAGTVDALLAEEGDFARDGDGIVALVDLDPVKVEIQASERYLGQIEVGTPATARLLDGQELEGAVSFVGRRANTATRTIPIEISFDNPEGAVIAGITATVDLPLAEARGHLLPASALVLDDEGRLGVMAVDDQDRTVFHQARIIGELPGGGVWLGGLPPALQVVVVGQGFLTAGTRVEPVEIERDQLARLAGTRL